MSQPRYAQGLSPDGRVCFVIFDETGKQTRRYCFSEGRAQEMVEQMRAASVAVAPAKPPAKLPAALPARAPRVEVAPAEDVYDPEEEQIRRVRLALYEKFVKEGYSKYKPISVKGRTYGPGQALTPEDAKQLAFQMAGRRRGSRFLYEGTNEPTLESRVRAYEKLGSEDAAEKRQRYEQMLAVGRKSGAYRITHEREFGIGGPLVWKIQPGDLAFRSREEAERVLARLLRA